MIPKKHNVTKQILTIGLFYILSIVLVSCYAKDNPNELTNTQFAADVIDSCHVLSPKTYSYLHNIKPPLGIKPVIVAVEKIEDSQMGTFADDLFDQFCKKKYSGNTFSKRGVLIVASKSPELVQVRVGKTYDVYCRMRGSAAGADYLVMQKEVPVRGLDEMCPIALNNVFSDIERCRQLPWYKRLSLKISIIHVELLIDDVATPSKSFFSQFYFKPFLYMVGMIRSIFGNWALSFLFIALFYHLVKTLIENKLNSYIIKKARANSDDQEDFVITHRIFNSIKTIAVFLIKLVITVPTLAAISTLSTSRMEDIIALRDANIPSVELMEKVSHWTNNTTGLWIVLMLMTVYYLKFLLCDKGLFTISHLSDKEQQHLYTNNEIFRLNLDQLINTGYNRRLIQKLLTMFFNEMVIAGAFHNSNEIDLETVDDNSTEIDNDGKPQKHLVDYLFLDTESPLYIQSPALALQVNTHREALYFTAFVGLTATVVFSYTYALYFLILWIVQLFFRIGIEIVFVRKRMKGLIKEVNPFRLIKRVWSTDAVIGIITTILYAILAPSYTPKNTDTIVEARISLPGSFEGLYFVQKVEGEDARGETARIIKGNDNNYYMQIYSEKPIRRFIMTLDEENGIFHCDVLGDGFITYDLQTKTTIINFSDLWILTN